MCAQAVEAHMKSSARNKHLKYIKEWVGTGGGSPEEKGQEEREERAGSRVPRWQKLGETEKKLMLNILLCFAIEIGQRGGNSYGEGQEAGVWE